MTQRSFDGWRDPNTGMLYADGAPRPVGCVPGRFDDWQPEWPKQEDVPHAGAEMLWGDVGLRVAVHGGIPLLYGGDWCVTVVGQTTGAHVACIRFLKPAPPKPETASGEVVGTVTVSHDGQKRTYIHEVLEPGTYTLIK